MDPDTLGVPEWTKREFLKASSVGKTKVFRPGMPERRQCSHSPLFTGWPMDSTSKETILFIDDEESILDVARTYFSGRGYQVLTAGNGRQAVEVIWNHRVDCCFTDINMPEMNGLEFAEYMRKYDNTVPVVIMTGYPSLDNTIHTLKNGVVDFLVKPINLQQMELCLQRVMRERKLFVENILLAKEVEGKAKLEELNRELLSKVEDLNILNRILGDFSSIHESSDVFSQLVDMTVDIAKAETACFYLVNESADAPIPIAYTSVNGKTRNKAAAGHLYCHQISTDDHALASCDPYVQSLIDEVIADDQPLLVAKNGNGSSKLPTSVHSFMLVPLKIRSKLFGVLSAAICNSELRFSEKELYYMSLMTSKAAIAIENLALYENIYNNLLATLYAFVKAIEARDPYTKQHSSRVTRLAVSIAREVGCTAEEQEILNVAGLLHDIGKIGIRDEILLKPGRLDDQEYRMIKQHPVIGAEIMDHLGLWNREKKIVRGHHERFDGRGYPDGLAGEQIPLLARILSIADVYDAIASDRAYRKRMPEEKILNIIYGGAGTQFDPELINVFRHMYETGTVGKITEETE